MSVICKFTKTQERKGWLFFPLNLFFIWSVHHFLKHYSLRQAVCMFACLIFNLNREFWLVVALLTCVNVPVQSDHPATQLFELLSTWTVSCVDCEWFTSTFPLCNMSSASLSHLSRWISFKAFCCEFPCLIFLKWKSPFLITFIMCLITRHFGWNSTCGDDSW